MRSNPNMHKSKEIPRYKDIKINLLWSLPLIAYSALLTFVLKNVVLSYTTNEVVTEVNISNPPFLPIISLCPSRYISDDHHRKFSRGFSPELNPLHVKSAVTNMDMLEDSETFYRKLSVKNRTIKLPQKFVAMSLSQIIRNISLDKDQLIASYRLFDVTMILQAEIFPLVKAIGMCYQLRPQPIPLTGMGYAFANFGIYFHAKDTTGFNWKSDTVRVLIDSSSDEDTISGGITLQAGNIHNIQMKAAMKHRIHRKSHPCKISSNPIISHSSCVLACINGKLCNDTCSIFDPSAQQSVGDVCGIATGTLGKCTSRLHRFDYHCNARCIEPCEEISYEMSVLSYSNQDQFSMYFRYDAPSSSFLIKEVEAVSDSTLFGYIGGNLGLFFGISASGVVSALVSFTCRKYPKINTRKMTNAVSLFSTFILVIVAIDLLKGIADTLAKQKTSSKIRTGNLASDLPELMLCGKWIDQEKLSIIPGQNLCNDNVVRKRPFCTLLQGLMPTDPYVSLSYYSDLDKVAKCRAKLLESYLRNKNVGLKEFLHQVSLSADQIVRNVHYDNKDINYTTTRQLLARGMCYHLKPKYPTRPEISKENSELFVQIMLARDECSEKEAGNGADMVVGRNLLDNLFPEVTFRVEEGFNYKFATFAESAEGLSTKAAKCSHDVTQGDYTRCVMDCVTQVPCSHCKGLVPHTIDHNFNNVTALCNAFMPPYKHCVLWNKLIPENLRTCEKICDKPCSATGYRVSTTSYVNHVLRSTVVRRTIHTRRTGITWKFGRSTMDNTNMTQSLHFTFSHRYGISTFEEFYVYDILSAASTIGGICGILFGYSFMTIFSAIGLALGYFQKCSSKIGFKQNRKCG